MVKTFCLSLLATLFLMLGSSFIGVGVSYAQGNPPKPAPVQGPKTAQFGDGIQDPGSAFFGGVDSAGDDTGDNAVTNLESFISRIIATLTTLAGLFFIVFFVLGSLSWITAGGDSGKIDKARNQMVQGTIGLIIVIASYMIVGLIGSIIGLDILNPGNVILTEIIGVP